MDRAERTGVGVALIAHAALFGILSVGFLATPNPLNLRPQPIEVTLSDEVGLESTAPLPSQEAPAPRLAEVEGPVEPVGPAEPEPRPAPAPEPRPAPRSDPRPAARPQPTRQPTPAPSRAERPRPDRSAPRPTGALAGIAKGLTDRPSSGRSTTPAAAAAGPAVKASLAGAVQRQLRPHWKSPTGADVDQLRTTVRVQLARDGSLAGEPRVLRQTGLTDANRAQAAVHAERAIRAVKLAAPFSLPAEYYDAWKVISPVFDKRLG